MENFQVNHKIHKKKKEFYVKFHKKNHAQEKFENSSHIIYISLPVQNEDIKVRKKEFENVKEKIVLYYEKKIN